MAHSIPSSTLRDAANQPAFSAADSARLLAALRSGDPRPLDALYRQQRAPFLRKLAFRFPRLTPEDYQDAYQDAFVIFCENISSGRLQEMTAAPGTYLLAVGVHRCQEVEKKFAKTINLLAPSVIGEEEGEETTAAANDFSSLLDALSDDPFALEHALDDAGLARQQAFEGAWQHLSGSCRELLNGFYYQNQTLTELADNLDYVDAGIAKVRKSQCVKRLRILWTELLPQRLR